MALGKAALATAIIIGAFLFLTLNIQPIAKGLTWEDLPIQIQAISINSPRNNSTYENAVSLVFTVNPIPYEGPTFIMGGTWLMYYEPSYSLDGKGNVTIPASEYEYSQPPKVSFNLTGLENGTHTIRVYDPVRFVNDYSMAGSGPHLYAIAYSETITFNFVNVSMAAPSPSSSQTASPSPIITLSPTQNATLEPTQSATPPPHSIPIALPDYPLIIGIVIAIVLAIGLGVSIYYKRTRGFT